MATVVDTADRLADALRILLPFAVADEPEWAPQADLASRHVAYAMALLALEQYDGDHQRTTAVLTLLDRVRSDSHSIPLVG